MKELYLVTVLGDSASYFEEYYSEEEIKVIEKFFNDMDKHHVPSYDNPLVQFDKRCSCED